VGGFDRSVLVVALGLTLTAGCARAGPTYLARPLSVPLERVVVFQDSHGPTSYQPPQGRDAGRVVSAQRVRGEACQRGFSVPILALLGVDWASSISAGWHRGGYHDALEQARIGLPPDAVLYDVMADLKYFMVLTLYRELCVVVDAAVAMPRSAPTRSGSLTWHESAIEAPVGILRTP
jgi:hypothetical protein